MERPNEIQRMIGKAFLCVAMAAFGWMCSGSAAFSGETLMIAGSSTVKPIVEAVMPAFKKAHPNVQVTVGGGGSSNGVKSAAEGNVAIGMASRRIKEKETASYPDIVAVPIGQDGVAVIVNKANPVEGLSSAQVLDLYTGKTENWEQLGGNKVPVNPVGILLHHGTASVFMDFFGLEAEEQGEGANKSICYWKKGDAKSCALQAKGVDGNQPSCAAVLTDPGAISFASIGFAQSLAEKGAPIKLLTLDGVEPTAAKVVSGAYPLSRPLLIITKGEASGLAKEFRDHLLSPEGQKAVQAKGYIPVH